MTEKSKLFSNGKKKFNMDPKKVGPGALSPSFNGTLVCFHN